MKSRVAGAFISSTAGRRSDKIAAFGSGRVCAVAGCSTLLSTYNPSPYCSVHGVASTTSRRS